MRAHRRASSPGTSDDKAAALEPVAFTVPGGAGGAFGLRLGAIRGIIRRQLWVVVACVLGALALAAWYLSTATPTYTASTRLLIEPNRTGDLVSSTRIVIPDGGLDRNVIGSQMQVMLSDNNLSEVVRALDLTNETEFQPEAPGPVALVIGTLKGFLSPAPAPAAEDDGGIPQRVLAKLRDNTDVGRVEESYVVEVDYSAADPKLAARIANTFAETYITDLARTRGEFSTSAIGWLDAQIADGRKRVEEADAAIRAFRAENSIFAQGVVNQQQLVGISTELVDARAARAAAEARLEQFQGFTEEQRQEAALPEALTNPVILELRKQYMASAAELAEVERVYSADHPDARRLRQEMQDNKQLVAAEIERMGLSYENEVAIASAREKMIEQSVASLRDALVDADESMATLSRLQRNADVAAQGLETLEQQRVMAIESEAHPSSEARVISPAAVPRQPSAPRSMMVIALALVGGCALGAAIGAVREATDGTLRTPAQVQALGLPCIALVPATRGDGPLHPEVRDALAGAKFALGDLGRGPRTIGVVSALPSEGTTSIAANLASLLAEDGSKVVLVDGTGPRDREVQVVSAPAGRTAPIPAQGGTLDAGRAPDVTVVELPPLATAPGAAMRAARTDALLLVAAWGRTPRSVIDSALEENPAVHDRIVGTVLTDVDFRELLHYAEHGSTAHYLARNKLA